MEHRQFKNNFKGWWCYSMNYEGVGYSFMKRLQNVKEKLIQWNKEDFKLLQTKRNNLIQRITKLDEEEGRPTWNGEKWEHMRGMKQELEHILLMEGRLAHQKLKVNGQEKGMQTHNSLIEC
ncbi:hypothetical protein Scep_019011 [Stephania cephalantha]|uniref:Uncharacterized protein n=1 Tax=Stephania cephalantha TaxID=152367 RepID=A0AAP0IA93_9MAGN